MGFESRNAAVALVAELRLQGLLPPAPGPDLAELANVARMHG